MIPNVESFAVSCEGLTVWGQGSPVNSHCKIVSFVSLPRDIRCASTERLSCFQTSWLLPHVLVPWPQFDYSSTSMGFFQPSGEHYEKKLATFWIGYYSIWIMFQTSAAVMAFTLAYLISASMAMVTSPPDLHSGSDSPTVAIASSTDHGHPSSIKDCEVSVSSRFLKII